MAFKRVLMCCSRGMERHIREQGNASEYLRTLVLQDMKRKKIKEEAVAVRGRPRNSRL